MSRGDILRFRAQWTRTMEEVHMLDLMVSCELAGAKRTQGESDATFFLPFFARARTCLD